MLGAEKGLALGSGTAELAKLYHRQISNSRPTCGIVISKAVTTANRAANTRPTIAIIRQVALSAIPHAPSEHRRARHKSLTAQLSTDSNNTRSLRDTREAIPRDHVMSSSITLSAATRQNCCPWQDTAALAATNQGRLSTGKR